MRYSNLIVRTTVRNPLGQMLRPLGRAAFIVAAVCLSGTTVRAGLNPPPDGGYPGQITVLGNFALDSMPASGYGHNNTAIGYSALFSTTTGGENTALGAEALFFNITGASNTATVSGALKGMEGLGSGNYNTAAGHGALFLNVGDLNT